MKQLLPLLALPLLLMVHCSGAGSGDSDSGFKLEPGTVQTYTVVSQSYNIEYNGIKNPANPQAIIFSGSVSGNDYIGIAICRDPSINNSFNMRLHFLGSSIPTTYTMNSATLTDIIRVRDEGQTTFTNTWSGSIQLDFTDNGNGTWTITGTGAPSVGVPNLTITSITAYKVGI